MREKIEALRERFLQELQGAQNSEAVEKLRVAYLGKKGSVTELLKGLKDVAGDQKKEMGGDLCLHLLFQLVDMLAHLFFLVAGHVLQAL